MKGAIIEQFFFKSLVKMSIKTLMRWGEGVRLYPWNPNGPGTNNVHLGTTAYTNFELEWGGVLS